MARIIAALMLLLVSCGSYERPPCDINASGICPGVWCTDTGYEVERGDSSWTISQDGDQLAECPVSAGSADYQESATCTGQCNGYLVVSEGHGTETIKPDPWILVGMSSCGIANEWASLGPCG